jgi:hypothetical protein
VSAITRSSAELTSGFTVASFDFLDGGGLINGIAAAAAKSRKTTTFS